MSLCCAACTKLLESDSTLVLISLIAHTQRSALSDAALITNDSDGGFFVLLLQALVVVNTHLGGYFHPLDTAVLSPRSVL